MSASTPVRDEAMERRWVEKVFVERDPGAFPVVFDIAALEKYAEADYTLYRTKSAGRVQSPEGWRLDFGIVDAEGTVHAALRDVLKLPRIERRHWAAYALPPGLNARYVKMQLGQGACVDEGDISAWDGKPRAETP